MAGDAEEYFMLSSRTNVRDLLNHGRSLTFVRDDKVLLTYQQTFSASPRLCGKHFKNLYAVYAPSKNSGRALR